MLLSMTGQGAAQRQRGHFSVAVEVRTVNSRYYKLALRATEGYGALESQVDETIRRFVRRGTVQVDIKVDRVSTPEDYRINQVVLVSYQQQILDISRQLGLGGSVSLDALLSLPGVVHERAAASADLEGEWPTIREALSTALQSLSQMREQEGQAMAADLRGNCELIDRQLDRVEARAPQVSDGYRNRLTERIKKLLDEYGTQFEPGDLIREVGLFAERSDISEEVVRLRSHLDQFRTIMEAEESSGRRLDFVTQEMFREANTIGSKANDAEIAQHVVEIKAAIERIREMIQNVE